MPKHRIGLQKEVSSIFKGVPLSVEDSVATSRHMPILEPPKYHSAPEPAVPEKPVVAEQPIASEPPASAEPELQPEAVQAPLPPKISAPKKARAALITKPPRQKPVRQSLQQMKAKLFAPKAGLSPSRQKAMVVLVPVLAIALVFVLTRVMSSPSRSVAKGMQKEPATAVTDSSGEIDWKVPPPYSATHRDPMQFGPLVTAKAEPQTAQTAEPEAEKLIIKSILHSDSRPSAVIGASIVHEGDKVLGATVLKIHKDAVEFEKDGKRWTQQVER
jgi:hypothetical protein